MLYEMGETKDFKKITNHLFIIQQNFLLLNYFHIQTWKRSKYKVQKRYHIIFHYFVVCFSAFLWIECFFTIFALHTNSLHVFVYIFGYKIIIIT